ncbi:MAG TPA: hypothetical protein VMD05_08020 [Candidatus Nanoarchaeia archaeon]|nr:hypothetical protein [Candidatus Nanoarchaeia archaeon]
MEVDISKLKQAFSPDGVKQWLPNIAPPQPPIVPTESLQNPNLIAAIQGLYQTPQPPQAAPKQQPASNQPIANMSDQTTRWGAVQKKKALK